MLSHKKMIEYQAEKHNLVPTEEFNSQEDYVLFLCHTRAYEEASRMAMNKRVLDLGCNIGYGSKIIQETCKDIAGVDISPQAIATAKDLYGQSGIQFQVIDGKYLPFDDNTFDLITSFQVIEHIVDYKDYFTEIMRVLAPQGMVIFTTPNALLRIDPGMKPWNPFHVREFSAAELEELLLENFPDVTVYGLFADEPLYSIEVERLNQARENARKRITGKNKFFLRSLFLKVLPVSVKDKIKDIRDSVTGVKTQQKKYKTSNFQNKYSTKNLYYETNNTEQALDLLALCRAE